MSSSEQKRALREKMKRLREQISDREARSTAICREIARMPEYIAAKNVLLYASIGSEVCLDGLIEKALAQGKTVLLPRCGRDGEMDAIRLRSLSELKKGKYGIREPKGTPFPPEEIDLVLCPGLAFDPCGARLGWGKGYYDRYLVKTHAFPAGVCFAGCLLPRVLAQENDVPMRAVVCEEGIKRIGGNI